MSPRNLVYYICTFKSNQEWLLNIRALTRFWAVFSGLKIITIARGEGLVDPEEVMRTFEDCKVKFIVAPNNPLTGETCHFLPALQQVSHQKEGSTFYAHAKGVSPVRNEDAARRESIRNWRDRMYLHCLRDPRQIDQVLQNYACAGCFKRRGGYPAHGNVGDPEAWHFSGSFFWFSNRHFERSGWDRLDMDRYGVEKYLSLHYASDESYNLYDAEMPREGGLYDMSEEEWLRADETHSRRCRNHS